MSASRNYNNSCRLSKRFLLLITFLLIVSVDTNAAETISHSANSIGYSDYLKAVIGLVFVIGLFLLSTFLFKRFGNGPMLGRGQLRIIDGLHLGNRERLMLVEIKDKQILLAVTPGKISKLDTLEKNISDNQAGTSFEVVHSNSSSGQST